MAWDFDEDKSKKIPVYVYPHIGHRCRICGGELQRGWIGVMNKRLQGGLATCKKCRCLITSAGFYSSHEDDFKRMNSSVTEKIGDEYSKQERKKAKKARKKEKAKMKQENQKLQTQPIDEKDNTLLIQAKKNEIFEIVSQTNEKLNNQIIETFKTSWEKVNLSLMELDNLSSVYFVRNNDGLISSIIISRLKKINISDVDGIQFITSRSELAEYLYTSNETNTPSDSYEVIEKIYFKDLSKQSKPQENNTSTYKNQVKETPNYKPDIKTVYVYFSLTNNCTKHKHRIESVTANTSNAKNGKIIRVNVFHCEDCDKYFINYEALQRYISSGVYPALPYKFSKDISGSLHDASKLRLYGYRVAEGTLTKLERQSILSWVIDSGLLTKNEIIKDLQFKVKYNGSKAGNEKAKAKWEDDIQFVSRYVAGNKRTIQATFVVRKNKL